jgi:hypothetical protein
MVPDPPEDPLAGLEPERLTRAFALGSGRRELDDVAAGRDPLELLALLSQRLRFGRSTRFRLIPTGRRLPSSPVPLTPRPVRVALLRLVESTTRGDPQELIVAGLEAVATAGFRLHPFDLPRLAPRLAGKQEFLGPVERAYLGFHRSGGQDEEESGDRDVTQENWTAAPKQRRLEFIRSLRLSDPEAARRLIEQRFTGLRAPIRAELVGVMALSLSPADHQFLAGLSGDRSPQVREAALALLGQIPGTEAYTARWSEALAMLSLRRAGLLKTRRVVKVSPPSLPDDQVEAALRERFRGLPLTAILTALEVSDVDLESLVEGVDRHTAMCLLWAAFADGDLDRLAAVAKWSGLGPVEILWAIEPDLASAPVAARRRVVADSLDLAMLLTSAGPFDLARLRRLLGGPLDADQACGLLEPGTWKKLTDRLEPLVTEAPQQAVALVAGAAALIPAAAGGLLRERLEPMPSEIATVSVRLAELLMAIANAASTTDPPMPTKR